MRRFIVLVGIATSMSFSSACRHGIFTRGLYYPADEDVQAKTVDLSELMDAMSVRRLLGPPDETEGAMCGNRAIGTWKCITWTYHTNNLYRSLRVTFQVDESGQLVVNNWRW